MQPGDAFVLFTDWRQRGVRRNGELFGEERLLAHLGAPAVARGRSGGGSREGGAGNATAGSAAARSAAAGSAARKCRRHHGRRAAGGAPSCHGREAVRRHHGECVRYTGPWRAMTIGKRSDRAARDSARRADRPGRLHPSGSRISRAAAALSRNRASWRSRRSATCRGRSRNCASTSAATCSPRRPNNARRHARASTRTSAMSVRLLRRYADGLILGDKDRQLFNEYQALSREDAPAAPGRSCRWWTAASTKTPSPTSKKPSATSACASAWCPTNGLPTINGRRARRPPRPSRGSNASNGRRA